MTSLASSPESVSRALRGEMDALLGVLASLSEPRSVEGLLDELLLQARRLTRAEAGTVFVAEGDRLRFVCCQNDARSDLDVKPKDDARRWVDVRSQQFEFLGRSVKIDERSLAGWSAVHRKPLRLDDVYSLPEGSDLVFDQSYDRMTGYRTGSMMIAPLMDRTGHLAGVMQLINRRGEGGRLESFSDRDLQAASALAAMAALSVRHAQMREELQRTHLDTILRLSTAAEYRDNETAEHIQRVSLYCETIARGMGMPQEWTRLMLFASPMHDVGKLGVPDAILRKPGPLTEAERRQMQRHTVFGAQILRGSSNELLQVAERIALSHHEKWDGTGYPNGVKGHAIPLEGRVAAVADVFDALTSKRVYKEAFSADMAFSEIRKGAGTHFDPEAAAAFLDAREEIEAVREAYSGVTTTALASTESSGETASGM